MLFGIWVRVEVQIVEQVVGIDAELNPGVFAEHRRFGQAKGLGQRKVQPTACTKIRAGYVERLIWRRRVSEGCGKFVLWGITPAI